MAELTHRLQVLVDEERYERLRAESKRTGAPVGELVRRAIDGQVPPASQARAEAAQGLLGAAPPSGAEPEWEQSKAGMHDDAGRGDGDPD